MRGVQVLVLPLVFPGEPSAPPHIGPALAAAGLGGALLEGIGCAGRVGVRRWLIEQRTQVQKVLLSSGTLVAGIGSPFGDQSSWGHAKRLHRVNPVSAQRARFDLSARL